jgi:hypothetical protein
MAGKKADSSGSSFSRCKAAEMRRSRQQRKRAGCAQLPKELKKAPLTAQEVEFGGTARGAVSGLRVQWCSRGTTAI